MGGYELYTRGDPELPPLIRYGYMDEKEFDVFSEVAKRRHSDFEAYVELCTALCKDNLPLFSAIFVPERDLLPHAPTIHKQVQGRRRTVLKLPRSHAKSTLWNIDDDIKTICYASIGEGERPRILNIQETSGEAEKTVNAVRSILYRGWDKGKDGPRNILGHAFGDFESRTLRRLPHLLYLDIGDEVTKEPTLEGVGVQGAITGAHPNRCKIDDPTSQENSRTEGSRERMWDWHIKTVSGLFDPGTAVEVLCTPKYEDDYPDRLGKSGKFNVQRYPALTRFPEDSDYETITDERGDTVWVRLTKRGLEGSESEGVEPLRSLWPCPLGQCESFECAAGILPGVPEHRSVEYLIFDKLLESRAGFAQEFMLEPYAPEEAPIKPDMVRCYCMHHEECWGKPDPWSGQPIEPFPWDPDTRRMRTDASPIVASTQAWDHAIGMKRRNDETAHARMYRTEDKRTWSITEGGHWEASDVIDMMEVRYQTEPIHKPFLVVTEAINFQRIFGQQVEEKAESIVPLDMVTAAKDKFTSLVESGYYSQIMNGKHYFDVHDPETVDQHLRFTGGRSGGRDDRVDANRLAFNPLMQRVRKRAKTHGRPRTGAPLGRGRMQGLGLRR